MSSETIEGMLQRIIFKNDTGFIIGAFLDKNNNNFTALGNMINPQVNMEYIFSGTWQDNHKFGEQLKFHSYETIVPKDENAIFKYIVRVCKYVGGAVGNSIIDKYGDQTLTIMKADPDRVASEIKGLSLDRAKKIQSSLLENEKTEKVMIELETILDVPGMRKNLPGELIKVYKSGAAEAIKDNPYILTQFSGISFFIADRVAVNVGTPRDSVERKIAATKHALLENSQNGNIWILGSELLLKINELIQVPGLKQGLEWLVDENVVMEDNGYYAFMSHAEDEMLISDKIVEMINFKKENKNA